MTFYPTIGTLKSYQVIEREAKPCREILKRSICGILRRSTVFVISMWRRWGSLAACLAIVIAVGLALPHLSDRSEQNDPPVLGGSPFEDVDGVDDFEKLGFTIDAPENAENIQYCIVDGEIARVRFSVGDHKYTYEAAKLDGNFSCADGDAVGSVSLSAKSDAVLDRLSPDTWRAYWTQDGVSYYLTNFDGAEEAAMTDIADTLIEAP